MTSLDDARFRREQRDALQRRVDAEIASAMCDEPRQLVQQVTKAVTVWLQDKAQVKAHPVLDLILVSSFVSQRYRLARHSGRPSAAEITDREVSGGGQLPLPGSEELIRWRWTTRNGAIEKSVWHSTLPELDALDTDYETRVLELQAKRRMLQALRSTWRETWSDPKETVEQFYGRMAKAA